jgi:hypothetical protein
MGNMRHQLLKHTVIVIAEEGGRSLRLTRLQRMRAHSRKLIGGSKALQGLTRRPAPRSKESHRPVRLVELSFR